MHGTAGAPDFALVFKSAGPGRRGREILFAAAYLIVLLWINLYICRDLFSGAMAHMNSMQGFWMAIATRAEGSWFQANWWPYWDSGIPFEATYAPLVPALTAAYSALRGVPHSVAFYSLTGLFYCLVPLSLFLMAWRLTRAPGYSFLAALFYSLTSLSQLLAPDSGFTLSRFWDPRRLFFVVNWDDTPHMAALSFLPLAILFLVRSIETRRIAYCGLAACFTALASLASAFGPVDVCLAAICLLVVMRREHWLGNSVVVMLIGAYAWAMAAPYLSPSLMLAIRAANASGDADSHWTAGSLTALLAVVFGGSVLWHFLRRWTGDQALRFFVLFGYTMASIPMLATFWNRHFLPQPGRYRFEMEMALSLAIVFAARPWVEKIPRPVKVTLLLLVFSFAGEQVVAYRQFEKHATLPQDVTKTVEYKASVWAARNLPGVRLFLPGSVGQWANAFSGVQQFAGGSFSMATNLAQQTGSAAVRWGDARVSLPWLKAYGVGAVGISGPDSKEYWHPFVHPRQFEGMLPVLWSEDGVTIYRVPVRETALAHVVPESVLVRHAPKSTEDLTGIEKYVAALDDPSLPLTQFRWEGRNRIRIRAAASQGQALSVQVSFHPGWHASAGGRAIPIRKDGLGMMWIRPECVGPCEVQLDYDGGWELRLCRWLSYLAIAGMLAFGLIRLPQQFKHFRC